jgi:hypothetical protein
MVRKPLTEPFKNITNRQITKKPTALTEVEEEVLSAHQNSEKN